MGDSTQRVSTWRGHVGEVAKGCPVAVRVAAILLEQHGKWAQSWELGWTWSSLAVLWPVQAPLRVLRSGAWGVNMPDCLRERAKGEEAKTRRLTQMKFLGKECGMEVPGREEDFKEEGERWGRDVA